MFTFELSLLIGLGGIIALLSVGQSLRLALGQAESIRQALDACPAEREVRFTLREVQVCYNDGKVVPLRRPDAISLPDRLPARAAA